MSQKPEDSAGKKVGDIVRSAFASGDLTRLKDIGPVVEGAVKDIPVVKEQSQKSAQKPPQPAKPTATGQQNYAPRPAWQGSGTPVVKKPSTSAGILSIVLGAVGLVGFGLMALVMGILSLVPLAGTTVGASAVAFLALFLGSGGVLAAGIGQRRRGKRVQAYYALLSQKPVRTFEEIAAATGWTPAKIKKDIRKAMIRGQMPDVRIDKAETCVMRGEEAYAQYLAAEDARTKREAEAAERQRRLADPATAGIEVFRQEGHATLEKIRKANAAISGEEISGKLSRLADTTGKIFAYVEKHPQKLPDTRRFMSYYLPTTLKLVDKYRQYEEMQTRTAAVEAARRDIEAALDTINTAFGNLLESLYQEDTLDVATDIQALKTVLEQEGLTGRQFEIDAGADGAENGGPVLQ